MMRRLKESSIYLFSQVTDASIQLLRRRGTELSPRTQRIVLLVAMLVFIAATVVTALYLLRIEHQIRWLPIFAAGIIGVPTSLLLNAVRYQATGCALNYSIGLQDALKVTVVGSAANLLPIPGSIIVRVRALAGLGSSYGLAILVSAAVGAMSVGTTFLVAGLLQLPASRFAAGIVLCLTGSFGIAIGYNLLLRVCKKGAFSLTCRIVSIETVSTLVGAIRLYVVLGGLGFVVSVYDTSALTVATAITTAIGIFPAGLGIKEVLVAVISPIVGLAVAAGLTAAVIDRVFRFAILGVVAGSMVLWEFRTTSRALQRETEIKKEG